MKSAKQVSNGGNTATPSSERRESRHRTAPPGFKLEPPDGGFQGWLVVAGAALSGMTIAIPQVTFSFILNDVLVAMNISTSTAAWIPSIISTVNMFFAPICSIVVSKYSCRVALMIGGLVSALGMIASFFAPSVEVLFLTYGVCAGAGQGMVINASLLALSQYFRRRYSLAVGIVIAFWAAGRLIFSPLIQLMLNSTFDYRGVILIASAIALQSCVGGATFFPVERYLVLVPVTSEEYITPTDVNSNDAENALTDPMLRDDENNDLNKANENGGVQLFANNSPQLIGTDKDATKMALVVPEGKQDCQQKVATSNGTKMAPETRNSKEESGGSSGFVCDKIRGYAKSITGILDFTLFAQPLFYILLSSRVIGQISSIYPVIFLPPYMINKGLEPMQAATIASVMAGAEIAGRVINPWVQTQFRLSTVYFFIVLSALQGIVLFALVFVESFTAICVIIVACGIFHGGCVAFSLAVMLDCFGPAKLSSVLALTKPIQGLATFGIGPIIGYVRDQTGNYDVCYSAMGVLRFVVSIIWCLKPLVMRHSKTTVE